MNMTYQPAPETLAEIIDSLSHLATFDSEEFTGFLMISRFLPKSEKAAAWHARASEHIEAAEALTVEAETRIAGGLFEVARALMEGVQIRLAAALHCNRMGRGYAALHARYSE